MVGAFHKHKLDMPLVGIDRKAKNLPQKHAISIRRTLPLALLLCLIPPAGLLLNKSLQPGFRQPVDEQNDTDPADELTQYWDAARVRLPREISPGVSLTDFYFDSSTETVYAVLVVPKENFSEAFASLRDSSFSRMTDSRDAICGDASGMRQGYFNTVLEFQEAPEGSKYQTINATDIFCDLQKNEIPL